MVNSCCRCRSPCSLYLHVPLKMPSWLHSVALALRNCIVVTWSWPYFLVQCW